LRQWFERIFWGTAVIALAIYLGSTAERWGAQAYFNWQFAQSLAPPPRATTINAAIPSGTQPMGRLEIPSIGLSAIYVEGSDSRTLRRAIGHIPGTALPGTSGNAALSAHRDTFFRHLGEVHRGDLIRITTTRGLYQYVVESSQTVDPDERAVLGNVGRPTLTLVTCYPFYYVGSAPKRFVVHAALQVK
jgi:sortase A